MHIWLLTGFISRFYFKGGHLIYFLYLREPQVISQNHRFFSGLTTAAMKLKNLPGNRRGFDEKAREGKNAAMKLENHPGNRRGFDAKARGKEATCAAMAASIPGSRSCLRAPAGEDCGRI
jgi:hypothetical protein